MEKQTNIPVQRENRRLASMGFLRRIYDVHSPCQWRYHCYEGKCPSLVHAAGNLYCSRDKI